MISNLGYCIPFILPSYPTPVHKALHLIIIIIKIQHSICSLVDLYTNTQQVANILVLSICKLPFFGLLLCSSTVNY